MNQKVIGVVGPCAAGKTTLVKKLKNIGLSGKVIAQEHSYVPDMWRRLTNPDVLIFLDASYPVTIRRKNLNWSLAEYKKQLARLDHARKHADMYLLTDPLKPEDVLKEVLRFISYHNIDELG
jgi:ABC-type cobalamin/Fe3+-siderophores transport system ATPase subunit